MDEETKELRSILIYEGKTYNDNLQILKNYKRRHPSEIISEELFSDDNSNMDRNTEMFTVLNADKSVKSFKRSMKAVEKEHGKAARKCLEEYLVDGKDQKEICNSKKFSSFSSFKRYWADWMRTALNKK